MCVGDRPSCAGDRSGTDRRLRPRHAARRRCTPPTVRRDLKVAAAPLTHTERGRQPAHPNEGKRPLAGRIQSRLSKMHQGRAHEQETRRAPARPEIERAPSARRPPRHRASRPRAAFRWRTAPGRTEDPPPSSASWPTTAGGGGQRPGRAPTKRADCASRGPPRGPSPVPSAVRRAVPSAGGSPEGGPPRLRGPPSGAGRAGPQVPSNAISPLSVTTRTPSGSSSGAAAILPLNR
jgi:hypothetical protein